LSANAASVLLLAAGKASSVVPPAGEKIQLVDAACAESYDVLWFDRLIRQEICINDFIN